MPVGEQRKAAPADFSSTHLSGTTPDSGSMLSHDREGVVFSNSPQSYEILCPDPHMRKDSLIFVTGHQGLVGSALVRRLQSSEYTNLIFQPRDQLDLRDSPAVDRFFASHRPEYVFMAAAKVG